MGSASPGFQPRHAYSLDGELLRARVPAAPSPLQVTHQILAARRGELRVPVEQPLCCRWSNEVCVQKERGAFGGQQRRWLGAAPKGKVPLVLDGQAVEVEDVPVAWHRFEDARELTAPLLEDECASVR